MSELIISVSGLRGIVGESLTPPLAIRYCCAFAKELPAGPVVVSQDGRTTGAMISALVQSGLQAVGRTCIDAGVSATPTLGVLVRDQKAAGGIQVSASHNPPEYNGLKLFSAEGRVIPAALGQTVIEHYLADDPNWAPYDRVGSRKICIDTTSTHLSLVLDRVNVERIRARKFKVLLDSNHGSGSMLGSRLLDELGCEVTLMGGEPHGKFAHVPEPTAENLLGVLAAVSEAGADIGFCQDPDADRLAVIDADGRYVGEEYTLALCVDHVLRSEKGPIVTNCSTSRMSQDLAEKYGVPFYRSAVGEANVIDLMLAHDAVLGGEGNGGAIDPRVRLVRDSFVGMTMILDAMAAREMSLAALVDELPRYEIHKTKVSLPQANVEPGLAALEKRFADATADRLDGLRLDWPDAWLLVRASNTEPIVRAIAEASTLDRATTLCEEAAKVLAEFA